MKNKALIKMMKTIPAIDAVLQQMGFQIVDFEPRNCHPVPAFRLEIFYKPGSDTEPGND